MPLSAPTTKHQGHRCASKLRILRLAAAAPDPAGDISIVSASCPFQGWAFKKWWRHETQSGFTFIKCIQMLKLEAHLLKLLSKHAIQALKTSGSHLWQTLTWQPQSRTGCSSALSAGTGWPEAAGWCFPPAWSAEQREESCHFYASEGFRCTSNDRKHPVSRFRWFVLHLTYKLKHKGCWTEFSTRSRPLFTMKNNSLRAAQLLWCY